MVAALEAALAVRRDERECVGARRSDDVGDELGREARDLAEPAFLPGGDELRHGPVVGDRRSRRGEGEPAARALAAARDRPGDRSAAARATRPGEQAQLYAAAGAQGVRRKAAGRAAGREDEVEERPVTLGADRTRVTHRNVATQFRGVDSTTPAAKRPVREADQWKGSGGTGRFSQLPGGRFA